MSAPKVGARLWHKSWRQWVIVSDRPEGDVAAEAGYVWVTLLAAGTPALAEVSSLLEVKR